MNKKLKNLVSKSAKYKYIYLIFLTIFILTISLIFCYSGLVCQANRFGISIIDPVVNNVRIVMSDDWAPVFKHDLSEGFFSTIIGLQFDKVKNCSVIGTMDIQNFLADEDQKKNIEKSLSFASYPWGDIYILDSKTESDWFAIYLIQYNLSIFTSDLSFLNDIEKIEPEEQR